MKAMAITAFDSDGPKTAASMIAKSSAGKAKPISAMRITRSSTQPPMAAASSPSAVPMLPPSSTISGFTPNMAGFHSTRSARLPTSTEPISFDMPCAMAGLIVYLAM